MKETINRVEIIGRLDRYLDYRMIDEKLSRVRFSIITQEDVSNLGYFDYMQEQYHPVVAYGNTAEEFRKHFNAGAVVVISGSLVTKSSMKNGRQISAVKMESFVILNEDV